MTDTMTAKEFREMHASGRRRAKEDPTIALLRQLDEAGIPAPEQEHRFNAVRDWRFDFCWPAFRIAFEIEGGAWTQGRHTRGSGFLGDMEKYNEAALAGYRLLRATPDQVRKGNAVVLIGRMLKRLGWKPEEVSHV